MSKRTLRSRTRIEDLESPKKVPKKDEKKATKTTTRPKPQSSKPATPKRQPAKSKAKAKPQTQPKKAIINGKENKETIATPKRKREVKKPKVEELYSDDDDDDEEKEEKTPVKRKRRKIVVPSDESGDDSDEYKPSDASDSDASISSAAASSEVDTSLNNTADTVSDDEPPPKREQKPRNPGKGKKWYPNKKKVEDDDESGKSFQLAKAKLQSGPVSGAESWPHLKYPFLQPENILDAEKRRPDHPEYNPKTLYVPQEFLDKQTPSMRQWWILKSQHFDCVLFHKIGKFYGMYHMDAVSGVNALGLNFIQRDFAYTGCFEVNYSRLFKTFVEKGYKVARVEQTETPEMMAKRCDKSKSKASKFDKLVRREVCQISTRGTRVSTVLDIENFSSHSNYLLSLVEDHSNKLPTYGICFIDTSIGIFHLGQFKDDCHNSRLLTLLSHYTPAHVVYGKGNLSPVTMKILNTHLPVTTLKEALLKDQFWSVKVILDKLKDGHYFKYESDEFSWPEGLKPFINYHDNNKTVDPVNNKKLAINAFGGCVSVLTDCVLDEQLLALKKFQTYIPPDMNVVDGKRVGPLVNMVIDAATIENLNILGKSPSLLSTLDYCCTDFGKRLLKEWVCRPACNRDIITARIDAVSELRDLKRICLDAKKQLSSLPDLERLLTIIHGHGNASKSKNHPDSRAIMCEWMTYNKRKITDLVTCLNGFKKVVEIMKLFDSLVSDLIVQTTQVEPKGEFPDMTEALNHFDARFDSTLALKQGCIIPKKGMDLEYDQVIVELEQIKNDADEYLKSQSEYFGTEIKYVGGGDDPYQLEVPESCASKVTPDYELENKRKGYKRYSTEQTIKLQERQTAAEEHHDKVRKDSDRRTFAKFSEDYDMWATAVYKVAVLDVLISLAEYSRIGDKCAPEINDTDEVMLDIQEGIHPFITSENFVPNDTSLAINGYGPLVILTGPNMGGKSTIMRQVGLLSIMAHIGCHIPAQSCKLSLIDRVFTRLGANDDMRTGRSTFLVELSEAATFVLHATKNSLVLVDELGRGTSTHDGTAIAAAILKALSKLECRTLFSTHYHMLVSEFKDNPAVSPAHMACQVESEETDATQETVTFLYKLTKGPCPKSYGFNAARIAGIKSHITKRANELAKKLEDAGNRRNLFISLCSVNRRNIKEILATFNSFSN
ncbi:probable DNA mismatch repair protein Msh6 isoform X2 [Cotesia glomerata]|uniref:probable DNA mismatch repair protein Msh6 isoform X2 n=1 Tax=Cotesia glomerata TaxID=32391 RepID=UPI001D004364|nr:probable DNA mismatch repair protein Msh6 isoform X2 [Cotesia glomerata]